METSGIDIVNVVASGSLGTELNLRLLGNDIGAPLAEYDPDKYPGLYLRLDDEGTLITLYRTGKYIITGASSVEEANGRRDAFLELLHDLGAIDEPEDEWFAMQNFVCTAELGEQIDLNALAIDLGLERIEYEPEQFPGLIYRPEGANAVILIFGSGKAVVTGAKSVAQADDALRELKEHLFV